MHSLFRWLVKDGRLSASPLEKIEVPISSDDQIQPFSEQQVAALISAASRSRHPARDVAIIKLLLDTGFNRKSQKFSQGLLTSSFGFAGILRRSGCGPRGTYAV